MESFWLVFSRGWGLGVDEQVQTSLPVFVHLGLCIIAVVYTFVMSCFPFGREGSIMKGNDVMVSMKCVCIFNFLPSFCGLHPFLSSIHC